MATEGARTKTQENAGRAPTHKHKGALTKCPKGTITRRLYVFNIRSVNIA